MRKNLITFLVLSLIVCLPALAQSAVPEAAATPELWVWKFELGHPYPNPCGTDLVKINLNMLAMDTNMQTYDIKVTSKVYNSVGQKVRSTDHGWISSSPNHPIVVVTDATALAYDRYKIEVTASCPTFGTSSAISRKVLIW